MKKRVINSAVLFWAGVAVGCAVLTAVCAEWVEWQQTVFGCLACAACVWAAWDEGKQREDVEARRRETGRMAREMSGGK